MDLRLGIVIGTSLLLASAQPDPPPTSACTSFKDLAVPCGCAISEDTFEPECGSDGVTYLSECFLECRKYVYRVDITIEYSGVCGKEYECECPSEYDPVCASNGVTYSNDCTLKCSTEKDGRIRFKHTGECGSSDQGYTTSTEEYDDATRRCSNLRSSCRNKKKQQLLRQPWIVELDSNEPVIPNFPMKCICAEVNRPVCGSNDKTYANFCVFFCMSKSDEALKFNHWGACKKSKSKPTTPPPPPPAPPSPKQLKPVKSTKKKVTEKVTDIKTEMKCVCEALFPEQHKFNHKHRPLPVPLRYSHNHRRPPQPPICHNHRT